MSKAITYAIPPPPPKELLSGNKLIIRNDNNLNRDKSVDEVIFEKYYDISTSILDLNGHTLTVGQGGIHFKAQYNSLIKDGIITSSGGNLNIFLDSNQKYLSEISSRISDNKNSRIGMDVYGRGA